MLTVIQTLSKSNHVVFIEIVKPCFEHKKMLDHELNIGSLEPHYSKCTPFFFAVVYH